MGVTAKQKSLRDLQKILMKRARKAPRMPVGKKKTPKPMTKEQKARKEAILKEAMRMSTLDRSVSKSSVFETGLSGLTALN